MLALLALLTVSLASAEDYADIVNRAFAAINNDFHATWAFTEAETEDGITHVGRYDPSRPAGERWCGRVAPHRQDGVGLCKAGRRADGPRG